MKVKCPTCNCYVDLMFESLEKWYLNGKKIMCNKCRNPFDIFEIEKKEKIKDLLTNAKKELNKIDQIRTDIENENESIIILENKEYKIQITVKEIQK